MKHEEEEERAASEPVTEKAAVKVTRRLFLRTGAAAIGGTAVVTRGTRSTAEAQNRSGWWAACHDWGIPEPDPAEEGAEECAPLLWQRWALVGCPKAVSPEQVAIFESRGLTVVEIPLIPGATPPSNLLELLGIHVAADVQGGAARS